MMSWKQPRGAWVPDCQYTDQETIRIKYDLDEMRRLLSNHMNSDLMITEDGVGNSHAIG